MASVPMIPDSYNHVLAEFECLDPLLSALRLDSSRLKVRLCCVCGCLFVSYIIIMTLLYLVSYLSNPQDSCRSVWMCSCSL